jgi:TonB family protein
MKVVHFEKMYYPPTAHTVDKQGIVVVMLKLDEDGNVVDVHALSGSVPLVRDTLDNARKWRFKPSSKPIITGLKQASTSLPARVVCFPYRP